MLHFFSMGRPGERPWRGVAAGALVGSLLTLGLLLLLDSGSASRPLSSPSNAADLALAAQLAEGSRLVHEGQAEAAATFFRQLIRTYPTRPEAYNNLASLLAAQGDLEAARKTLEQALFTNASYATVYQNLGVVYAELARDSYGKALRLEAPAPSPKLQILAGSVPGEAAPAPLTAAKATAPAVVPPASIPAPPPQPAPVIVAAPPASPPTVLPTPPAAPTITTAPLSRPTPAVAASPEKSPPLPAAAATPPTAPAAPPAEQQVRQALQGWARAWADQDVAAYLGSYSKSFQPGGNLSRGAWEEQRRQRLLQPRWIEVELKNFRFLASSDQKARVEVMQEYRSSHFRGRTRKRFDLVRENGQWRIATEQSQ